MGRSRDAHMQANISRHVKSSRHGSRSNRHSHSKYKSEENTMSFKMDVKANNGTNKAVAKTFDVNETTENKKKSKNGSSGYDAHDANGDNLSKKDKNGRDAMDKAHRQSFDNISCAT